MLALHIDNDGDEVVCRVVEVAEDGITALRVVQENWRKPREQFEAEQAASREAHPEEWKALDSHLDGDAKAGQ
jgi:predicted RNA-binding protein with RPS1 domain